MSPRADRRQFMACLAGLQLSPAALSVETLWAEAATQDPPRITREILAHAVRVAGDPLSDAELDAIVERVNDNLRIYADLNALRLDNTIAPPLYFNPVLPGMPIDRTPRPPRRTKPGRSTRPAVAEDIAFLPVTDLAELVRTRRITSVELTEIYLDRLKRYSPRLQCVVTVTEDRARRQAKQADDEIASGRYRGPLHGIPWGVKDLFATKEYPTTWGAAPFKDRVIDVDATVVSRLDAAGAVLVAKLATGELARDDLWFGGQTKNPWNLSCRMASTRKDSRPA
jgi:Amidase